MTFSGHREGHNAHTHRLLEVQTGDNRGRTFPTYNAASRIAECLRELPNVIPDIVSFTVGRDILHLERSFDTGLVAVFPDRAALDVYTDHPQHQEVAALGKQIAEKVVSVDFVD
jgi:hypothetical protein